MLTRRAQPSTPSFSKAKKSPAEAPKPPAPKAAAPAPKSAGRNELRAGTGAKGFSGASSFAPSGRRNPVELNPAAPQNLPEQASAKAFVGGQIKGTVSAFGIGDVLGGVADAVSGAVSDAVGTVVDGGRRIIGSAGDFAIDVAEGTLEFAGDVAELTAEAVREGVQFAVEQGLELAGPLLEEARDLIQGAVLDGLNIEEKIDSLEPGDSLSIGGEVNVTAGIEGSAAAALEVTANEDGTYTVSSELEADLGVKLFGGGTVGAGGKVEFTFPDRESAIRGAESLALAGAGTAAALTPPFQGVAPLLLPGGEALQNLTSNISAIELSAEAAASVEAELELGTGTAGAGAGVEAGIRYRLELEDGRPVALVRQQHIEGSVSAGLSAQLFADSGVAGSLDLAQAEASANYTLSTRIPLPGDLRDVGDVLQAGAFLADVSGTLSNLLPNAETSLEGTVSISGGGTPSVGAEVSFEVPDVEVSDGLEIASELAQGNLSEALRELPDVQVSGNVYTETGFEVDGGLEVAGEGIELNLQNVVRDVRDSFEVPLFE